MEGNSELAASLETPEAQGEGSVGCDGQSVHEWVTALSHTHHGGKHTAKHNFCFRSARLLQKTLFAPDSSAGSKLSAVNDVKLALSGKVRPPRSRALHADCSAGMQSELRTVQRVEADPAVTLA